MSRTSADRRAPDALEVANALRFGVSVLMRRLRQVQVLGDLSLPERAALVRLDREGPSTAAELARVEQISPQSMGATVAALEARGLVRRRTDRHDGRRVVLSVSAAGAKVLRDRRAARAEQLAAALASGFSPGELGTLAEAAPLLERLAQLL
jgi:DNA-binding MarR family transcriptional regulator